MLISSASTHTPRGAARDASTRGVWVLALLMSIFAVAYAALLLKGPFDALPGGGKPKA